MQATEARSAKTLVIYEAHSSIFRSLEPIFMRVKDWAHILIVLLGTIPP